MAVTILDIAKASGKSYPTVSRALNNHPKISVRTTAHIKKIADELGYRPSFAGKMLKSGRTNILSIIVSDLADPFYSEYISRFKHRAAQDGFDVVVYDYELDPKQEQRCLERILSGYSDGCVAFISSFAHTAGIVQKLWNAKIPLVAIGTPHEFDDDLKYDMVVSKYGPALVDILKTLKQQKRKKIVFVASKITDHSLVLLENILKNCSQAAGFPSVAIGFACQPMSSGNQAEDGLMMGRKVFTEIPDADTLVVWNGFQAYGLVLAAQEADKRIPDDIAIIVRDNTWVSKYSTVPFFSIDQRLDLIAHESFKLINKKLDKKHWGEPVTIEIPSEAVYPDNFNKPLIYKIKGGKK